MSWEEKALVIEIIEGDVLIIGGGAAAVRAAIAACGEGARANLISKGPIGKSGATPMAGGSTASPNGDPRDNPEAYFDDTMNAGRGLSDPELVKVLAEEGAARVREWIDFGVEFTKKDGQINYTRSPGHSYPRSVNSPLGGTGLINPLRRVARQTPNLHIYEDVMATRLLVADGRVQGALTFDLASGDVVAFVAPATVLASGGYQDLYPMSDAASDATGDGYSLAFEAGAALVDMEMLLYYPTVLVYPYSVRGSLITYEFYLNKTGLDAHLVNTEGQDLLAGVADLPMRDELTRLIFDEVRAGRATERGGVFIDNSLSSFSPEEQERILKVRTPSMLSYLSTLGIPVVNSRLEVGPAAHFVLGGVRINARCETSVPGLFAAGEVSGNLHGANRLGANALTETQVFGRRAGIAATLFARSNPSPRVAQDLLTEAAREVQALTETRAEPREPIAVKNELRTTMLEYAGPTRDSERLAEGLRRVKRIVEEDIPRLYVDASPARFNYSLVEAIEARLMASTALLVIHSALSRKETRGHHYRVDFPTEDTSGPVTHTIARNDGGQVVIERIPVGRSA